MTYIAPNSVVELFRQVDLSDNYENTLYFASSASKDAYFDALNDNRIGRYTAMTYTREERNYCRIQASMYNTYNANYMRYKNSSFENKWFYAFVKNVEYINNEVVQINFVIDVMVTWMGEFSLDQCFIERMHSTYDVPYSNLTNEPLACSEYVYNSYSQLRPYGLTEENNVVVIAYTTSGTSESLSGGTYHDGIYSGLKLRAFYYTDLTGINDFISDFSATPDSIITMYMCPRDATGLTSIATGGTPVPASTHGSKIVTFVADTLHISTDTLDGYTPRNKKLFNYPFNYYLIDNGQGETLPIKYEFCNDHQNVQLECSLNVLPPVTKMLRPYNYKNSGSLTLNTQSLSITGYPLCSWSSDAYSAWLAQNTVDLNLGIPAKLSGDLVNALTSGSPQGVTSGIFSAVQTVSNALSAQHRASLEPDTVRGNIVNGNSLYSADKLYFHGGRLSIPAPIARQYDLFFDMYGYAVNALGSPNMRVRPYWTYLKTVGCSVRGNIPSADCEAIERLIDNGIRFWTDLVNVGSYSNLDNRPTAG